MVDIPDEWLWIVVVGFIVSFVLAFGIGANDVANSFGTSVGSKVLTLIQACLLATIFEILGSVLIGYKVSDTIRKGIIDVNTYNGTEELLLLGNLSALSGSCLWMLLATFLRLPVSGTHSIVGATVGYSLVAKGTQGISWYQLGMIVVSWLVSPVLSGIVTALVFMFVQYFILNKENQLESGLSLLPFFYGVTIAINALSIFLDGSELLQFDKIPLYGVFILSCGLGVLVALVVRLLVVPWQRSNILNEVMPILGKQREVTPLDGCKSGSGNGETVKESTALDSKEPAHEAERVSKYGSASYTKMDDSDSVFLETDDKEKLVEKEKTEKKADDDDNLQKQREDIEDKPETKQLFSVLQILTAVFASFAHGGNDVSNSIGPLVSLWVVSSERSVLQTSPTPLWVLLYGGLGMSVGLWVWGRRVIQTLGEDLSKVTPSSGFCIELGSSLTVLGASKLGFPISTTHCKVGSIITVGRQRSRTNVDWRLFRGIFLAWGLTLPASGIVSAALMAIFMHTVW